MATKADSAQAWIDAKVEVLTLMKQVAAMEVDVKYQAQTLSELALAYRYLEGGQQVATTNR